MNKEEYYLAIDIETGGIGKPIFAIGAVLFKRVDSKEIHIINEEIFAFKPLEPNSMPLDDGETFINYGDFDPQTWDKFWVRNFETLTNISKLAKYCFESEILEAFYQFWSGFTKKYHNLRIVSDNPAFDIGYLDCRLIQIGKRPLAYQFRNKNWYYVSPLDSSSLEYTIQRKPNGKELIQLMSIQCPFEYNHNPMDDAKYIAWQFIQYLHNLEN